MASRLELQAELEALLGSRNVYFQPPESLKLKYPAIVYSRSDIRPEYADDSVYTTTTSYDVTVIDPNPDSTIVAKIAQFKTARFNRHFTSDNLNHDIFKIYY